jgi:hypothetical protein
MDKPLKLCTGKIRQPVALMDANGQRLLCFPSIRNAADILRVSVKRVCDALRDDSVFLGHRLARVTAGDYRSQQVAPSECLRIIKRVT